MKISTRIFLIWAVELEMQIENILSPPLVHYFKNTEYFNSSKCSANPWACCGLVDVRINKSFSWLSAAGKGEWGIWTDLHRIKMLPECIISVVWAFCKWPVKIFHPKYSSFYGMCSRGKKKSSDKRGFICLTHSYDAYPGNLQFDNVNKFLFLFSLFYLLFLIFL